MPGQSKAFKAALSEAKAETAEYIKWLQQPPKKTPVKVTGDNGQEKETPKRKSA
jgi:hypothetical protein